MGIENEYSREIPLEGQEKREELEVTEEERRFVVDVRNTIFGWFKRPVAMRKWGRDGQDAEFALERWYRTYCGGRFPNPYYIRNQYDYLPRAEEEIKEWLAGQDYLEGSRPPTSLMSSEEMDFIEKYMEQKLDQRYDYKFLEKVSPEKLDSAYREIKATQRREFEKLREQMPRFAQVAAKLNRIANDRKARELGIPPADFQFMVDYEFLREIFGSSAGPESSREGEIIDIFGVLWQRWSGKEYPLLDFKPKPEINKLTDDKLENRLREIVQGNEYRLEALDSLKQGTLQYKYLTQKYTGKEIRNQYAEEIYL